MRKNPISSATSDFDHIPLVDQYYKIAYIKCEFNLFNLHHWLKKTYLDQRDDINIWESLLPIFMFPQVHHFLDFIIWCQAKYNPVQRTIVAHNGDILVTISPKTVNQMLLILENDFLSQFYVPSPMDLYHKLTFPWRDQIFESFLPKDDQLPKKIPPYPTSMFPQKAKQAIFLVSFLLGYQLDQWVDEPIVGFLPIFSKEHKPTFMFNFSHFLADNIHEQLMKITTEGMFKYASVLLSIFIFQQGDKFPIALQKKDDQGVSQLIEWTSLVRRNSMEFSFTDFIDRFIHTVAWLLNNQIELRINPKIKRIFHVSD